MEKNNFTTLASDKVIETTKNSLEKNGMNVIVANNQTEAKKAIFSLIPEGAEVMSATSITLTQIGVDKEINESGKYKSVKDELMKLNRETDHLKMQKLGAAPEYIIGSVHAVTEDGKVIVASNTGSQLPGYAYGSAHVIWVVSTKKIVKNLDDGFKRIEEHIVPLEDVRIKQHYGPTVSTHLRKLLIFNSEGTPNRITIVFVKEDLGF